MTVINHNLAAMNARRRYNISVKTGRKSAEKLSSGYRINRAADDAAGLTISEKMRAQIRGLNQGAENLQSAISYVQVADGALNEVHSMLQRMNELAVQAANGTNTSEEREALNSEVQQLKTEMDRVFETTLFNNRQIWAEESIGKTPVWIGTRPVQGVKVTTASSQRIDVSNSSYDKIAHDGYTILADENGVSVSWKDYDGINHETKKIDWATFENNGYSFQVGDYFDQADTELFDGGNPVFDFNISLAVEPEATYDDIIVAIHNTKMSSSAYVQLGGRFEDTSGNAVTENGVSVSSIGINYSAAYASREKADTNTGETGYNFDVGADSFAEALAVTVNGGNLASIPANNTSDVSMAKTSTDKWKFAFEIDGIGRVETKEDYIFYKANDLDADDENLWWDYYEYNGRQEKGTIYYYPDEYGKNSLGSVMTALTGGNGTGTPGLLAKTEGGMADSGGTIFIRFDLISDNNYTYAGNQTSSSVGSLVVTVKVLNTDTEQTVLDKINDALNSQTILDLYTTDSQANSARHTIDSSTAKTSLVDRDVYAYDMDYGEVKLNIQAGPNEKDMLVVSYDCLRVGALGLTDTNVLNEDTASEAITQVGRAINIVSEQRSLFGAYQNRMESAVNANLNTAENTTAGESRIRDADMSEESMTYTKESILQQIGQKMISNQKHNQEGVLNLLRN